jgi:hypothetical protein
MVGIIPSIGFLVAAWLSARAGLSLVPMLLVGFTVWGIMLSLILILRKLIGV